MLNISRDKLLLGIIEGSQALETRSEGDVADVRELGEEGRIERGRQDAIFSVDDQSLRPADHICGLFDRGHIEWLCPRIVRGFWGDPTADQES